MCSRGSGRRRGRRVWMCRARMVACQSWALPRAMGRAARLRGHGGCGGGGRARHWTLLANGSYSYVQTAGGGSDVFTYTIRDADGSLAHATLTITLGDSAPSKIVIPAPGLAETTVFEAGLLVRTIAGIAEPAGSQVGESASDDHADRHHQVHLTGACGTDDRGQPRRRRVQQAEPTTTQPGTITFTSPCRRLADDGNADHRGSGLIDGWHQHYGAGGAIRRCSRLGFRHEPSQASRSRQAPIRPAITTQTGTITFTSPGHYQVHLAGGRWPRSE